MCDVLTLRFEESNTQTLCKHIANSQRYMESALDGRTGCKKIRGQEGWSQNRWIRRSGVAQVREGAFLFTKEDDKLPSVRGHPCGGRC